MNEWKNLRIGQGYDSHALIQGRAFVLGGVTLDVPFGALGHSDGDCLLHALLDGVLGALGKGDIGLWYPDSQPQYKDADSAVLFRQALLQLPPFELINVDITIFLDRPKLNPYREAILASLATLLDISQERLNVKAKTWEGFTGKLDVVAASVSLLLMLKA